MHRSAHDPRTRRVGAKRWRRWLLVVPVVAGLPLAATVSQGAEDETRVYDLPDASRPPDATRVVGGRSAADAATSPPDAPVRADLHRAGGDTFLVLSGPPDAVEGFVGDQVAAGDAGGAEAAPTEAGARSFARRLPETDDELVQVVVDRDRAVVDRSLPGTVAPSAVGDVLATDEIRPLSGRGPMTSISYTVPGDSLRSETSIVVATFAHAPIRSDIAVELGGRATTVAGGPAVVFDRADGGAYLAWSPDDAHLVVLDCSTCTADSVAELATHVVASDEERVG